MPFENTTNLFINIVLPQVKLTASIYFYSNNNNNNRAWLNYI